MKSTPLPPLKNRGGGVRATLGLRNILGSRSRMSRLSEYLAWLQPKMKEYSELMTKYKSVKERECAISSQNTSKKSKKETLLAMKQNKTISREGASELLYIQQDEDTKALHVTNLSGIDKRREREIKDAKDACDKAIAKAEERFENAKQAYDIQYQQSSARVNREWEAKKNMFQLQKQCIEDERQYSLKTATEMTIEQDKVKVLREIEKLIGLIEYAKKSTLRESELEDAPTVPVLPEPIVAQFTPEPPATIPPVVKYDYSMLGEDPATVALRQEMLSKRREKEKEEDAIRKQEMAGRPPTRYGLVHVLEGRPAVTHTYVAPVIDDTDDEKETLKNDFFTRDEE